MKGHGSRSVKKSLCPFDCKGFDTVSVCVIYSGVSISATACPLPQILPLFVEIVLFTLTKGPCFTLFCILIQMRTWE